MVYVKFSDASETEIVISFCCPQSPDDYDFLGEVEEDDERYITFLSKFPQSRGNDI